MDGFGREHGIETDETTVAETVTPFAAGRAAGRSEEQQFPITAPQSGLQNLLVRYANGFAQERTALLRVDGGGEEAVRFPSTGSWERSDVVNLPVNLSAGHHWLSFQHHNHAGPSIMDIILSDGAVPSTISSTSGGAHHGLNIAAIAGLALLPDQAEAKPGQSQNGDHGQVHNNAIHLQPELPVTDGTVSTTEQPATNNVPMEPVASSPLTLSAAPQGAAPGGENSDAMLLEAGDGAGIASSQLSAPVGAMMSPLAAPSVFQAAAVSSGWTSGHLQAEAGTEVGVNAGANPDQPADIITADTATKDTDIENASAADGGGYVDFPGTTTGGTTDYNAGEGQYLEWTVNAPEEGDYDLHFGYAFQSGDATNRPMRLDVNNALWDRVFDFPSTGDNTAYDEVTTRVHLTKGDNFIRLTANGYSGPNVDYLEVRAADPNMWVFQGEDLASGGNAAVTSNSLIEGGAMRDTFRIGAEGASYLDWAGKQETAQFTFDAPAAGTYSITVTYANGGASARQLDLVRDGSTLGTLQFAPTKDGALTKLPTDLGDLDPVVVSGGTNADKGVEDTRLSDGWENWTSSETLTFTVDQAGPVTLSLASGTRTTGPNIDKIVVSLVDADEPAPINEAPVIETDSLTVAENQVAAGTVMATDGDSSDTLQYSLTDNATSDNALFTIDQATGTLTFKATPDYEGTNSFNVEVAVSDGHETVTKTIGVTVTDVNEAPSVEGTPSDQTVEAGTAAVIALGLTASDPDAGDVADLKLGNAGDLPAGITLSGDQLSVADTVPAGSYTVSVVANDGELDSESVSFTVTVEAGDEPTAFTPFVLQAEDAEVVDLTHGAPLTTNDTQVRDLAHGETPSTGKELDANNLRPGHSGEGYVDYGLGSASAGDHVTFNVDVTTDGTYELHFRYSNGGDTGRPLLLDVDGADAGTLAFASTSATGDSSDKGWTRWGVETVSVELHAGVNTVSLSIGTASQTGPNLDALAITEPGGEPSFFVPVFTSATTASVLENTTDPVMTVAASDGDGTALTYDLTATGADNALFTINPATGALSFITPPDYEQPADDGGDNTYTVEVSASDGTTTVTQTVTVSVANDAADDAAGNSAPGFTSEATFTIDENQTDVGVVSATDADGDAVSYAITGGADAAAFAIDATSGTLSLKSPGDAEAQASYEVVVSASDGQGGTTAQTIAVELNDVNEAPVLAESAAVDPLTLTAGTAGSVDLAAALGATDPDQGDTVSYAATLAGGDPLPSGITVNGTSLAIADTVAAGSYEIAAFASDGELDSESVSFTVTVEDSGTVEPAPFEPIVIQAEDGTIALAQTEDSNSTQVRDSDNREEPTSSNPTGLRPGFTGTGYLDFGNDAGDTATYTMHVTEAGTYDLAVRYASNTDRPLDLVVNGGSAISLPFVSTDPDGAGDEEGFDHWEVQTVSVELQAGDNTVSFAIPSGLKTGPNLDALAITEPGGEPSFFVPVFTSATTASVLENTTDPVMTIAASDGDGTTLTYALTDTGADNALFTINPATGALSFITPPDYEQPADDGGDNTYTVEVSASDGTTTVTQTVTVSVANDAADDVVGNTAPSFTSEASFTIDENQTDVGVVSASDVDGGTVSYAITGGADANAFAIDATNGALTLKSPGDAETQASYQVIVSASDGQGGTTDQTIAVELNDINEAPSTPTFSGTPSIAEDAAAGLVIGNVAAADPDAGDTLTFTTSDPRFEVDDNGNLVVANGASFDFDTEPSISLTLTATDTGGMAAEQTISIAVSDVAAPQPTGPLNLVFSEAGISSYAGAQDGGHNFAVADDGATLALNDNHWKRAALGSDYMITADTKIVVDVKVGEHEPELVAVGFDTDDNAFDGDRSVYLLDGTDSQSAFVNLKGSGEDLGNGTMRYTIDLRAHAGTSIDSLVFVADDDSPSRGGLGSVSFSNVQIIETGSGEPANTAPHVVGGGIADIAVNEHGSVEIDMPFVDADGDPLAYTFSVTDSTNTDVTGEFGGLSFSAGTLAGALSADPGVYTVTVSADDGEAAASDSFQLTIVNVNEAPMVEPVALEPYFAETGHVFDGLDINQFASFFSDPDGDELTFGVDPDSLPAGLSLNDEGVIVGTPEEAGDFSVIVTATDPAGLSASLTLDLRVEGPEVGDVYTVEAEAFTGLGEAEGFFASAAPGASGNQIIRTTDNATGAVSTNLATNGLPEGYYTVTMTVFDETDGTAHFSLQVGDQLIADNMTFDDNGSFDNGGTRGSAGQVGNLKTITFDSPVFVDADTLATITGTADGELLRIDKLTFTRIEQPNLAPEAVTIDAASVDENAAGAVIGTLSAADPDGNAVTFTVDDERFVVDGTTLKLADGVSLDHETDATVTVSVTATDSLGAATTTALEITVNDVNEAPVLADNAALDPLTLTSGTAGSVDLAAALGATDPDQGDTVSYGATLANGDPLPAGITVNATSLDIADTVAAGTYEIAVFASDGELDSESVSFTVTIEDSGTVEPGPFEPIVIQAEDGTIALVGDTNPNDDDTQVRDSTNPESNPDLQPSGLRPGFTGTGYLDFGNDAGDTVTYTVNVAEAGTYDLAIRYATNTDRPADLAVNGGTVVSLPFVSTDPDGTGPEEGFDHWGVETVSVELQAGDNTFSLAIPAGAIVGPNLDSITITKPDAAADISADEDGNLAVSGPQGTLSGAAAASINFQLTGVDPDVVKVEVSFDNGETRLDITDKPDGDGAFVIDGTSLPSGPVTATFIVTDEAGNEATTAVDFAIAGSGGVDVEPFTIQAEDGTTVSIDDTGAATDTNFTRVVDAAHPDAYDNYRAGAVDGAYVDFGSDPGDAITFNVDAPAAGTYLVTFRYANGGDANRPLDLSLNGGAAQSVDFVPGPVVGTGADATGWESWEDKTVELTLEEGANTISLAIPAGAANGPNIDQATFVYQDGGSGTPVEPFSMTVEGETFAISDIEVDSTVPADTVARTPAHPEDNATAANSGPGLQFDANGLRPGYEGTGYLDMGGEAGDAASFQIDAPSAGTYQLTLRYANGDTAARPMTVEVDGQTQTIDFDSTKPAGGDANSGWQSWTDVTVDVELAAGSNTISFANVGTAGPNIDNVTVSRDGGDVPVDTRGYDSFESVIKVNFQPDPGQTTQGLPSGYSTPAGYEVDSGGAYGNRGNGFTYGWVTETSVADGTANGTTPAAEPTNALWYKGNVSEASDLQKTYAHFEYPGAGASGSRAWEMALENGTYQVKMSVGDTAGAYDSDYQINVEGQAFFPGFTPVNLNGQSPTGSAYNASQDGEGFRSTLVTGIVQVEDGKLTIDSIGGTNTEIQYLEVERVPDLTPDDGRTADQDYSFFTDPVAASLQNGQVSIAIGENGEAPMNIDPTSSFVVGVSLQAPGQRGPSIGSVDHIKLVDTLTGEEVPINVQISGGQDSLTIRPLQQLDEHTSYTLKVEDVYDLGSVTDPDVNFRQLEDLTTTFVTGTAPENVARDVAFTEQVLLNGYADNAVSFTSVEFGPDGRLYAANILGDIYRWDVNTDGTIDKASRETLHSDYFDAGSGGRRSIIGLAFDPEDANTIWITDNYPVPREGKAFSTPDFSGQISKVHLGAGGSLENATVETYITGLPRSGADHVSNSLEFRVNPNAGDPGEPNYLLYMTQGSNSAGGAPDNAWGFRPERLLNAAVLEVDPRQDAPNGGFNVVTEPIQANPTTPNNPAGFNDDGTYDGYYNPFASDAVLKIYAMGVRNAYDLVWHSNGHLYTPTNGTAAGANSPDDPSTPQDESATSSPKQVDYLFDIQEDGYYGHPNPLRGQYILNGGNPTSGADPNEVGGNSYYPAGTLPDPNYDIDNAYSLGFNQSPNGAIEYMGTAFGSNLEHALLFVQFSTGDNVRMIRFDDAGNIIEDDVLRRPDGSVIDTYIDPLDIIENPNTGQLYLMTLNRGSGGSQLVLLTPAPGGVTQDITADEGNNLDLVVVDASDIANVVFQVNGLDNDITAIRASIDGGAPHTITLDGQNRFTADLSGSDGAASASITVTDDAFNQKTVSVDFTPGEQPTDYVTLVTIQAEDRTPGDGTAVTIPTTPDAEIQIRDASNPETGVAGLVDGLRPGAYGLDGNTNNTDGVPGGYADFGKTNADYVTFTFDVPAGQEGEALLRFRYANGDDPISANGGARPLQVEVNGTVLTVNDFVPTPGATTDERLANWQVIEIPAELVAGQNTVTLRSVDNDGPNIDQLEVMIAPANTGGTPGNDGVATIGGVDYVLYEAENASLDGAVVVTEARNQQGAGFVDFAGTTDQSITWTVTVGGDGTYGLDFLYALSSTKAARPMSLSVDGTLVDTLPFAPNSNADETSWAPQSTELALTAGTHEITVTAPLANGPNVDQLRITKEPVSLFEPSYAAIDGEGRIELEATDSTTHTVSSTKVEFYFTVDSDGVYALDTAANANAANGSGLTFLLNGNEIGDTNFPGTGDQGEESVYAELTAGTQYKLTIISDAPGANALDYLDVRPAPGNANADIVVDSLDPAFYDNRLQFSWLENNSASNPDRDYKESGTIHITNEGTEQLQVVDSHIDGPFKLAQPTVLDGLTLEAGQSIDVEVLFDRAAYTAPTQNSQSGVFTGSLELVTNDADTPVSTIDLAGFWQARDEGGWEPNLNEVWQVFGFGNHIDGLPTVQSQTNSPLNHNDIYEAVDENEILSPYWKLADGVSQATYTQIAAYHGTGGAAISLHAPGNKGQSFGLSNHAGDNNQSILPVLSNGQFATKSFGHGNIPDGWNGDDVFGIQVAGNSTDPRLNTPGSGSVPDGAQRGYFVRIFQALDQDGHVIPNTYLGVMDYTGINYDYNDNMFVIEGIAPVGFGQHLAVSGLDDAAADERLVFTNIDHPANGAQEFRNEATFTISNDGFTALSIDGVDVGDPSAFEIVGSVPTSIAAGASAEVTVRFIGSDPVDDNAAVLFKSSLTIHSDDFAAGEKTIALAGLAQNQSENGEEPTVAQIAEAFGYTTDMAQAELAHDGAVEAVGDEVLMPYLERLDSSKPVEVIQLAAFLQQNNVARLSFHGLGSADATELFAQDDQQYQTVLPDQLVSGSGSGASVARGTINQDGPFGLYVAVDGRPTYASWSDPEANRIDPGFGNIVGDNQGHLVRFFQALDAAGNAIEGTYIGIQDYPGGGNYDYNDHVFVIKNVQPHDLTAAEDADGDGVNDALQLDADHDGTVDFFDPDTGTGGGGGDGNGGDGGARGDYVLGVNFGGGAIANDPVLGVALVGQNDSRVSLSGSVNPGAGVDAASNLNGAHATPGSAFTTYEDGSNWTANIAVDNGTYVVVLHTQETYWNSAGKRVFDASINGQKVIDDLDVFSKVGGDKPYAVEAVVTVTNGVLSINMDAAGADGLDNAPLNAVTIYKYDDGAATAQTPFNGTPFAVDADGITIDATDYDNGGQDIAYHDAAGLQGGSNGGHAGSDVEVTSGGDLGWIANGEWVEYTIDVAKAGTYQLVFDAATPADGRSITAAFEQGGSFYETASTGVANTGSYTNFQPGQAIEVDLQAGQQTLRLTLNGGSFDFRSFDITPVGDGQAPHNANHTPWLVDDGGLTLMAAQFDEGGPDVAYHDTTAGQLGNDAVRPGEAVDIVGNGDAVGWVANGEWVEYTINVESAGAYDLSFLSALGSQSGGRSIQATFEQNGTVYETSDAVAVSPTGNWSTFEHTDATQVDLEAGVQTMRVNFAGGSQDLASFTLTPAAAFAAFAQSSALFAETADAGGTTDIAAVPDQPATSELGHLFTHDMIA